MENNDPKRKEDVKDPIGRRGWPVEKGRDGERTPMQWNTAVNAGFSTAKPWLPVAPNYKTHNVASEEQDAKSVLHWYRALASLRSNQTAIRDGKYISVNNSDPNVLSYLRRAPNGETILVVLNMSNAPQTVHYDLREHGAKVDKVAPLLQSPAIKGAYPLNLENLKLPPLGVFIGKLD
jgi:alpha-glucosidase